MSLAHRRKNTQTQRKTNTQDNTHKHEYADLIGQILRKVEASPQSQVLCCPTAVRNPWVGGTQWDSGTLFLVDTSKPNNCALGVDC